MATTRRALPTGPTLNPIYNDVLTRWGDCDPECEDCGGDLTGREVHETRVGWFCDDCIGDNADDGERLCREDFHADI